MSIPVDMDGGYSDEEILDRADTIIDEEKDRNGPRRYCFHPPYSDGHCATMVCSNYVNKCPKHSMSGRDYESCNHESLSFV